MGRRLEPVLFWCALLCSAPAFAADGSVERWRVALPEADGLSGDADSAFAVLHRRWWAELAAAGGADLVLSSCPSAAACAEQVARGEVDFTGPAYWNPDARLSFTRPVARVHYVAVHQPGQEFSDARALDGQRVLLDEVLARERSELLGFGVRAVDDVALDAGTATVMQDSSARLITEEHRVDFGGSGLAATGLWTRWLFVQGRGEQIERLDALVDSLSNGVRALESSFVRPGMRFPHLLQEDDRLRGPAEAWALVDARPVIELGASRWEPLTVVTDAGYDGLALRMVTHHYERAGLTPVYAGGEDWRAVRADAIAGRSGGLGFVVSGGQPYPSLRFSEMITDMPLVALARADESFWASADDLDGRRVVANPAYAELRGLTDVRRIGADDPIEMLRMLRDGEVGAWIEYLPIAERAIEYVGARDVKIALRIGGPTDLRTAVHEDLAAILPLLDDSIARSSQAGLDAAIAGFSDPLFTTEKPASQSVAALLSIAVFALVALVAGLRLRNARRSLRQRDRAMRRAQLFARVGSFELHEGSDDVFLDGETPALLGLVVEGERMPFDALAGHFQQAAAITRLLTKVRDAGEAEGIDVYAPALERWFRWELRVERSQSTRARRIIGTIRDITDDREHTERELELEREVFELQKLDAIGQLAAGIAHDFNNALAANIGFTEEAKAKLAGDDPVQDDLDLVLRTSLRSRDLVQQILAFSRGTQDVFEAVRLDAIVSESLDLVRASSPASVALEARWPDEAIWVQGNATRLSQIAVNLIKNAVDAAGREGRVEVEVGLGDDASSGAPAALLVIRDDGAGIAPEHRGRIFEPFFTTKPPGEGNGLGLAVVHGLVTAHKGRIDVTSEAGAGTEFVVTLPSIGAPEVTAPTFADAAAASTPAMARVVVVDDEPLIVRVFERALERSGYQVVGIGDPRSAIEHFEQGGTADVLVTDLTMPGMSGVELARRLRELAPAIELVLMTGNTLELDQAALDLFGEVLEKPVLRSAILAAVEAATERAEKAAGGSATAFAG